MRGDDLEPEQTDAYLIATALAFWANYIETGNITTTALDASQMGRKINPLTMEQMRKVIRLRDLSHDVLFGRKV